MTGRSRCFPGVCLLAWAVLGACTGREVEELPPVRTPVGLRFACHPPENVPPAPLPPVPPGGSCSEVSCIDEPLRADGTQKGDGFSVVIRFDRDGTIVKAFVPEERSPQLDACVLEQLRSRRAPLKPPRDCMGKRLAGDVILPYRLLFPAQSRPEPHDWVDQGVSEFGRHICEDVAAASFWRRGSSWSVLACVDGRFLVTTWDGVPHEREGRMTREHDAALRRAALDVLRAREDPAASPRYWAVPYGDASLNVCVRLAREPQFCVTLWEHEGKRNPDGGTVPAIGVARQLVSLVSPERAAELDQWLAGRTPAAP